MRGRKKNSLAITQTNDLGLHRAPVKPKETETVSGELDLFTEAETTKIRALK